MGPIIQRDSTVVTIAIQCYPATQLPSPRLKTYRLDIQEDTKAAVFFWHILTDGFFGVEVKGVPSYNSLVHVIWLQTGTSVEDEHHISFQSISMVRRPFMWYAQSDCDMEVLLDNLGVRV